MSVVHTEGTEVTQTVAYFYLLQEDGFRILQEDGSNILIEGISGVRIVSTPYRSPVLHTDQLSTVVSHVG